MSRRPYVALNCVMALSSELSEEFRRMELNIITPTVKPMLCAIEAQPILMEEIHVAQARDLQLERIKEEVPFRKAPGFAFIKVEP